MIWTTSNELLHEVQQAYQRLASGESDAVKAHAEARLLGVAAKVIGIQLDHARLTQRLVEGSDVIPIFRLSAGEDKPKAK